MPVPSTPFGYLPDPVDRRDWDYQLKLGPERSLTLVEHLDWRPRNASILTQGDLGSCVGQAVPGAVRLKHVLDGVKDPELGNRLHIYAGARSYIGTLDWDSGSHIRDAFRFINSMGYMPERETDNKYDITKFRELPSPEEQRIMFDQKNKRDASANRAARPVKYYRIFDSGAARKPALKEAMNKGGVPVLGTTTTEKFIKYKSGILQRPDPTERQTGGHAFYLCGYTEDYVIMANSWGDDWGLDGYCYLSWNWIFWEETRDIWVVDKAPYFSHLEAA